MRHRSRRTVADWRRAVFVAPRVGGNVQVLLLFLADHMKADRQVSVPRTRIASALGISERRVTERVAAARAAGFLDLISGGYRGHVPVYQGTFPEGERETPTSTLSLVKRETPTSTLSMSETRTLSTRERVTPGGPTSSTPADLSADQSLPTHDRNDRGLQGGSR